MLLPLHMHCGGRVMCGCMRMQLLSGGMLELWQEYVLLSGPGRPLCCYIVNECPSCRVCMLVPTALYALRPVCIGSLHCVNFFRGMTAGVLLSGTLVAGASTGDC